MNKTKVKASVASILSRSDGALARDLRYLRNKGPKPDDSLSIFFISGLIDFDHLYNEVSDIANFRFAVLDKVYYEITEHGRIFLFNFGREAQVSYSWTDFVDDCVSILKVSYSSFSTKIIKYLHDAISLRRQELRRLAELLKPDVLTRLYSDLDFADRVLDNPVITDRDLSRIIRTSISPGFIKQEWRINSNKSTDEGGGI